MNVHRGDCCQWFFIPQARVENHRQRGSQMWDTAVGEYYCKGYLRVCYLFAIVRITLS
jgi:hypothetical protein